MRVSPAGSQDIKGAAVTSLQGLKPNKENKTAQSGEEKLSKYPSSENRSAAGVNNRCWKDNITKKDNMKVQQMKWNRAESLYRTRESPLKSHRNVNIQRGQFISSTTTKSDGNAAL